MIDTTTRAPAAAPASALAPDDPARRLDWRRLRSPVAVVALVALTLATVGSALGTVVAGRLAEDPTTAGVALLALCVVGAALLDTAGQVAWAGVVDRAEGRLRGDLLSAALHQPLPTLTEQAVGEVLDRVDDDTHAVGALVRRQLWGMGRTPRSRRPSPPATTCARASGRRSRCAAWPSCRRRSTGRSTASSSSRRA